jgi:hypothetical protein
VSACLLAIDRVNVEKKLLVVLAKWPWWPWPQGCPRLTLHEEVP